MEDYLKIITIVTAALTPLWAVIVWVIKLQLTSEINNRLINMELRFEDQSLKFKIIWEWMMRFSIPEALKQGLITQNSPIQVTPKSQILYEPITQDLKTFYQSKKSLQEYEIEILVAHKFGKWITDNICLPLNIDHGSCIKTAMIIAKS